MACGQRRRILPKQICWLTRQQRPTTFLLLFVLIPRPPGFPSGCGHPRGFSEFRGWSRPLPALPWRLIPGEAQQQQRGPRPPHVSRRCPWLESLLWFCINCVRCFSRGYCTPESFYPHDLYSTFFFLAFPLFVFSCRPDI